VPAGVGNSVIRRSVNPSGKGLDVSRRAADFAPDADGTMGPIAVIRER